MHNTSKHNQFGGWWKVLAVMVGFGYTVSTVIAYDPAVYQPSSAIAPSAPTSLQKEIETEVALSAQKVWRNLLDFMQQGISSDTQSSLSVSTDTSAKLQENPQPKSDFVASSRILPHSEAAVLPAFGDIDRDTNKASIETLASIGIFKAGENGKFYPHNFVRCSDFIRVMTDVYRYKLGYAVDSEHGYQSHSTFTDASLSPLLLKKLNTAKAL